MTESIHVGPTWLHEILESWDIFLEMSAFVKVATLQLNSFHLSICMLDLIILHYKFDSQFLKHCSHYFSKLRLGSKVKPTKDCTVHWDITCSLFWDNILHCMCVCWKDIIRSTNFFKKLHKLLSVMCPLQSWVTCYKSDKVNVMKYSLSKIVIARSPWWPGSFHNLRKLWVHVLNHEGEGFNDAQDHWHALVLKNMKVEGEAGIP